MSKNKPKQRANQGQGRGQRQTRDKNQSPSSGHGNSPQAPFCSIPDRRRTGEFIMREFNVRDRSRLVVMMDKFRPGRFAAGVAAAENETMEFKGDLESYHAACAYGRQRLREIKALKKKAARRTSRNGKGGSNGY